MVNRIKIFPAPHVELRVHVSDEMIKDYRECERIARQTGFEEHQDCDKCSWRETEIGNTCMCELKEMQQLLADAEQKRTEADWKKSVMRTFLGGRA